MDDDSRVGIIAHERNVFLNGCGIVDARKNPLNHLKSIKTNMTFAYNILFLMVTICVGTVGAELTQTVSTGLAEWNCAATAGVFKRSTD